MNYYPELNGTLHKSSDGTAGTGRYLSNHHVYVSDYRPGSKYPILLGDRYSNQLGWVRPEDLRINKY